MYVANGRGSYKSSIKPSLKIIFPRLTWVRNDLGGDAMVWLMALLDDEDWCKGPSCCIRNYHCCKKEGTFPAMPWCIKSSLLEVSSSS